MHNREDQQQLIVNFSQIFLVVKRNNENDDEENWRKFFFFNFYIKWNEAKAIDTINKYTCMPHYIRAADRAVFFSFTKFFFSFLSFIPLLSSPVKKIPLSNIRHVIVKTRENREKKRDFPRGLFSFFFLFLY